MTRNKSAVDINEVRKRRAEILRQYSDDAILDSFEAGWRAVWADVCKLKGKTISFDEWFYANPLIAIAGGGGVNLYNSVGNAWTADYLKITGELDVDLRSNIAAEARAKIVYERLINFCRDAGTRDALQFIGRLLGIERHQHSFGA